MGGLNSFVRWGNTQRLFLPYCRRSASFTLLSPHRSFRAIKLNEEHILISTARGLDHEEPLLRDKASPVGGVIKGRDGRSKKTPNKRINDTSNPAVI